MLLYGTVGLDLYLVLWIWIWKVVASLHKYITATRYARLQAEAVTILFSWSP